jgi:hypothetical protein
LYLRIKKLNVVFVGEKKARRERKQGRALSGQPYIYLRIRKW